MKRGSLSSEITRINLIRQELFAVERQFIDTSQSLRRQQYCWYW